MNIETNNRYEKTRKLLRVFSFYHFRCSEDRSYFAYSMQSTKKVTPKNTSNIGIRMLSENTIAMKPMIMQHKTIVSKSFSTFFTDIIQIPPCLSDFVYSLCRFS